MVSNLKLVAGVLCLCRRNFNILPIADVQWTGGFFCIFCTFFICRPSDSTCRRMLGSNPGLLRLWHWQSDALTTRLDLIHGMRSGWCYFFSISWVFPFFPMCRLFTILYIWIPNYQMGVIIFGVYITVNVNWLNNYEKTVPWLPQRCSKLSLWIQSE